MGQYISGLQAKVMGQRSRSSDKKFFLRDVIIVIQQKSGSDGADEISTERNWNVRSSICSSMLSRLKFFDLYLSKAFA